IDPAGTAKRNLVRLTVRERGFAKLGLDESVRRRNYEENYRGWEQQLGVAKRLAEGGGQAADESGAPPRAVLAPLPTASCRPPSAARRTAGERDILEGWAGSPKRGGSAPSGCARGGCTRGARATTWRSRSPWTSA